MYRTSYITTSIPYVNAAPHVGFALELVQADAIARYRRLRGENVRLQSGTDENALKNVLSARARGIPVRTFVDENAARFEALTKTLDISIDSFVRTTSERHANAVVALLSRLRKEDLYTRDYRGLYCVGCEEFYDERDLVDGLCPDHRDSPTVVSEENVFFRLSNHADVLHERIASRELHIVPEQREREVLRFIERGLQDVSISRDARRSEHWGIPFPGAPSQIVYVWIDALINYLTGLGYPDGDDVRRYWCAANTCHVIGKNVWKFHAVYWPALLLSAGLPLPKQIVVHGFLTENGRKISKSHGQAAEPTEFVQRFGVEALRYFLLRHVRPFEDSDFSEARLAASYEADLANGLGNLFSRLTALCESARVRGVSADTPAAPPRYHAYLEAYQFDLALETLWAEIASINRDLVTAKPWAAIKARDLTSAQAHLSGAVERLAAIAYWLAPFLPATSSVIRNSLTRDVIRRAEPLFPRL